ncbi:MAG: FadR family transcriptional regulator [Deltaproteobacteria bacterium]|jgi:GntR family transcriptional repressor for pyruvate dehydrogenase complex|nr:FadR family transcriptional regulator [Deltaproteobacteria bacterium]
MLKEHKTKEKNTRKTASPEKQRKAPEIVVHQMMKQIETGELKAGQKLPPQSELSKLFGVGMSSVREAINILQVMGYLEVTHGRGTFIKSDAPLSKTLLEKLENDLNQSSPYELFELRELVECQSVKTVSLRADSDAINEIKSALATLRNSNHSRQSFLESDLRFHLAIPKAIGLKGTAAVIRLIFECMHKEYKLASTTQSTDYRKKAISSAEDIVRYIEKGDDANAVRCMKRHLDLTKYAIINLDVE